MYSETWAPYPTLYEIDTWVWLADLSVKYGAFVKLASVPAAEWDDIAALGFDAVWLMGVWERSPAGTAVANRTPSLREDFHRALPDYQLSDNAGSPYCVKRYVADQLLGGAEGLAQARKELANRGMRLILDFVPNHVAPDHEWAAGHPEFFIQGSDEDIGNAPSSYSRVGGRVFACGRDPYFPAWPDVLQLNAFDQGLRRQVRETVAGIAGQCDGIRCDMAMLLETSIFERTWGGRAGERPPTEFWSELIPAIKRDHPAFLFIAEAYWDREGALQQQGFDFCYDKRLYDRLEHGDAESVRLHLCADLAYQRRLMRFIENHDEPRAAATFLPAKHRAAAIVMATLPGARLFHEGQFDGRKVKLPVFLGRRPAETQDKELRAFYLKLLKAIERPVFHSGVWSLCEVTGWPDNASHRNVLAWCWSKDEQRFLVTVNLSGVTSQARVHVPWDDVHGHAWLLIDALSDAAYEREGDEIESQGLFVELGPWSYHLFQCRRRSAGPIVTAA